jgi:hypothetical protein
LLVQEKTRKEGHPTAWPFGPSRPDNVRPRSLTTDGWLGAGSTRHRVALSLGATSLSLRPRPAAGREASRKGRNPSFTAVQPDCPLSASRQVRHSNAYTSTNRRGSPLTPCLASGESQGRACRDASPRFAATGGRVEPTRPRFPVREADRGSDQARRAKASGCPSFRRFSWTSKKTDSRAGHRETSQARLRNRRVKPIHSHSKSTLHLELVFLASIT